MDLGDSSNSEGNQHPGPKTQKLDEEEIGNQEDEQKSMLVRDESERNPDPDPKRQKLDGKEIRNQESMLEDVMKNEDEKVSEEDAHESFLRRLNLDPEDVGRSWFDPDSENEENNTSKRQVSGEEESSESEDVDVEEEEEKEEEEDWKKGKTKQEQLQMMIDSFQNKDLFKSDGDDLSEDEFGCHEMTYQEFIKYNFEVRESGGFEVSSYPDVFSCGMIIPYHVPPKMKLDKDDLDRLSSFAQKALDKYNQKKNTNYCNMRVEKANIEPVAGYMYYITLKASNDAGVRTFRAKVYEGMPKRGIPRIKISFIRPCK